MYPNWNTYLFGRVLRSSYWLCPSFWQVRVLAFLHGSYWTKKSSKALYPPPTRTVTVTCEIWRVCLFFRSTKRYSSLTFLTLKRLWHLQRDTWNCTASWILSLLASSVLVMFRLYWPICRKMRKVEYSINIWKI